MMHLRRLLLGTCFALGMFFTLATPHAHAYDRYCERTSRTYNSYDTYYRYSYSPYSYGYYRDPMHAYMYRDYEFVSGRAQYRSATYDPYYWY